MMKRLFSKLISAVPCKGKFMKRISVFFGSSSGTIPAEPAENFNFPKKAGRP